MRVVVSDYDGTMYHGGELIGDVVAAIDRWRDAGNSFGIATGRDYSMIMSETRRWDIPVDFVISTNGAAVYDADGALIASRALPDPVAACLLRHPAALASLHFQLSTLDPLRVYLTPDSWFPQHGVSYAEVTYDEALALTGLLQISFAFRSVEECVGWDERLAADFGDAIERHRNKATIDLVVAGVDKAAGVDALLRRRGWSADEVFTLGDGGNDLPMLLRYTGYTLPGAQEEVAKAVPRVCRDLADMMDIIDRA